MEKIRIAELEIDVKDLLEDQAKVAESIRETKQAISELEAEQKRLREEGKINSDAYRENGRQIELNKNSLAGLTKEYKNNGAILSSVSTAYNDNAGTIDKLIARNKELRTMLRGLNLETDEGKKKQKEYIAEINKNTEGIRENSDAAIQQTMNIGNYKSAFDLLPPSLKNVASGFKTAGNAAKMALANPIGIAIIAIVAIVGAIATLVKAFTSTEEGGDRVKKTFDQIKAAIGVVTERIQNFATGLAKVFSGEARLKDLKGTFKDMGDEMQREVKIAGDLADMMDRLESAEIDMLVISADRKAQIDKLKEAAADQNKTDAERISLMRQAQNLIDEETAAQQKLLLTKIANELGTTDLKAAQERLNKVRNEGKQITLDELGLANATEEDRKRANELIAQYIGLEEQAATEKRRTSSTISGLVKNETTEREKELSDYNEALKGYYDSQVKMAEDEMLAEIELEKQKIAEKEKLRFEEAEKERIWNEELATFRQEKAITDAENERMAREIEMNDRFQAELDALAREQEAEIQAALKSGASVALITKKYAAIEKAIEMEKQKAKMDIIAGFAGSLAQLFGEETKLGKAAAIVQTVINTYKGAMSAFAETPGGIVIKSIAAGTAIATGVAAVRNIMKAGKGDSGGVSTSISDIAGTNSMSTEVAVSPSSNFVNAVSSYQTVLVIEDFQRVADNVVKVRNSAEL